MENEQVRSARLAWVNNARPRFIGTAGLPSSRRQFRIWRIPPAYRHRFAGRIWAPNIKHFTNQIYRRKLCMKSLSALSTVCKQAQFAGTVWALVYRNNTGRTVGAFRQRRCDHGRRTVNRAGTGTGAERQHLIPIRHPFLERISRTDTSSTLHNVPVCEQFPAHARMSSPATGPYFLQAMPDSFTCLELPRVSFLARVRGWLNRCTAQLLFVPS